MTAPNLFCPHKPTFGVQTGFYRMVPSAHFSSLSIHQLLMCKHHLSPFCCWMPYNHAVEEMTEGLVARPSQQRSSGWSTAMLPFPPARLQHAPASLHVPCFLLPCHTGKCLSSTAFYWASRFPVLLLTFQAMLLNPFLTRQNSSGSGTFINFH